MFPYWFHKDPKFLLFSKGRPKAQPSSGFLIAMVSCLVCFHSKLGQAFYGLGLVGVAGNKGIYYIGIMKGSYSLIPY